MKAVLIGLGVVLVIILGFVGLTAATYVQYHDQAVQYESKLDADWKSSKLSLSNYTTKVQEIAQVPAMYKKDLQDVVEATFNGRYGNDGSKAVFQFIKEQNMPLDPTMYQKIQQVMESGRNEFKTSQDAVVDTKRSYENQLKKVWSGFWMKLAGYPKVDLDKYKIVVVGGIDEKFESGQDEVIKLN